MEGLMQGFQGFQGFQGGGTSQGGALRRRTEGRRTVFAGRSGAVRVVCVALCVVLIGCWVLDTHSAVLHCAWVDRPSATDTTSDRTSDRTTDRTTTTTDSLQLRCDLSRDSLAARIAARPPFTVAFTAAQFRSAKIIATADLNSSLLHSTAHQKEQQLPSQASRLDSDRSASSQRDLPSPIDDIHPSLQPDTSKFEAQVRVSTIRSYMSRAKGPHGFEEQESFEIKEEEYWDEFVMGIAFLLLVFCSIYLPDSEQLIFDTVNHVIFYERYSVLGLALKSEGMRYFSPKGIECFAETAQSHTNRNRGISFTYSISIKLKSNRNSHHTGPSSLTFLTRVTALNRASLQKTIDELNQAHQDMIESIGFAMPQNEQEEGIQASPEVLQEASRGICVVCHTKQADVVLIPCGHVCVCGVCSPNVKSCPLCRKAPRQTQRVYFA